jgi:hypothetical protein
MLGRWLRPCFDVSLVLWSYFNVITEEMLVKEDPCRAKPHFPAGILLRLPQTTPHFFNLRDVCLTYYTSDATIPWHVTGKHAPSFAAPH